MRLTHALLLLLLAPLPAAAQADTAAGAAHARRYTTWLLGGQADSVFARLSERMRQAVPDAGRLAALATQIGPETALVRETAVARGAATAYTRVIRAARAPAAVQLDWVVDDAGTVHGLLARPAPEPAPSAHAGRATLTPLRLPFDGEWTVVWGGRTPEQNHHATHPAQRFAYDLLVTREGRTHEGDGSALEQYHCWGRPILAPADGVVSSVVEGIADTPIRGQNREQPAGNHVVIDHGNGEHSLLAHLRQGSVAVREGERVRAGQVLGACGNSGNSSEPHLHYHLQDRPESGDAAAGLPAQFRGYVADGAAVERGEPVRGQRIRPAGG